MFALSPAGQVALCFWEVLLTTRRDGSQDSLYSRMLHHEIAVRLLGVVRVVCLGLGCLYATRSHVGLVLFSRVSAVSCVRSPLLNVLMLLMIKLANGCVGSQSVKRGGTPRDTSKEGRD